MANKAARHSTDGGTGAPDKLAVRSGVSDKKGFPWRLVLILTMFVSLWIVGHTTGLTDNLSPELIRENVEKAGYWGILLYLVIFSVGELIHVPGMVFVAAGILVFGGWLGFLMALIGALVSVCFSFVIVRTVGGKAITGIDRPFIKKMLARLDKRPITTVIVLRLILWLLPALNYALALSNIRFRDYTIGSGIGLVIPVLVFAIGFEWIYARFFI